MEYEKVLIVKDSRDSSFLVVSSFIDDSIIKNMLEIFVGDGNNIYRTTEDYEDGVQSKVYNLKRTRWIPTTHENLISRIENVFQINKIPYSLCDITEYLGGFSYSKWAGPMILACNEYFG